MLVINLFGSPGVGKSTGAAYVFSKLKMMGINAELVTEYAKDKVWEEAHAPFENQLYMLAKQYFRMTRCENKVDVIITDSPLLLSLLYNTNQERLGPEFDKLTKRLFNGYNNLNFYINRTKPYNSSGRLQTEEESKQLEKPLKNILKKNKVCCIEVTGDEKGYNDIVQVVLGKILKDIELDEN